MLARVALSVGYTRAMPSVALHFDARYTAHDTGAGHPERPERLAAIERGFLAHNLFERTQALPSRTATDEEVARIHPQRYIARLKAACASGATLIDTPDCPICSKSERVARDAVGAALAGVDAVMTGQAQRAFVAVRPPGHHAEREEAMGFCLYATGALAVAHARAVYHLERIAVFDFDVHHGNGTQHIFEADPNVLFISTHADPTDFYPNTGFADETGCGTGAGYTLNLPLTPGAGHDDYLEVLAEQVVPRIRAFDPQLLVLSAGFDAHADDPLGILNFSDQTYREVTAAMTTLAGVHTEGRIVSLLEGGYNLGVLERCVAQHVIDLLEHD